jgi:hypothetical protein
VCCSPHGPGRFLVPVGLRLVKNAYLTNASTNTASITYAGRSNDSNWEEDEMSNIVNMDGQLGGAGCSREDRL